ncbi:hypothetical protein EV586_11089 [Tumebacillus sp. BK434]|nr:hypothetical protein EV586_11089 [Tumebacillus sp. BK434]
MKKVIVKLVKMITLHPVDVQFEKYRASSLQSVL